MANRVVFFTGAGMSAESGIKTFRDHDGLWEGYDLMEVAHIDAWNSKSNQNEARQLMLNFYNQRRKQLFEVNPNDGHLAIAAFEKKFPDTWVITQNVDDLHERAASKNVLHLHGELRKVRSELEPTYILDWNEDVLLGDVCPKGGQLRPHIVWFGEALPNYEIAYQIIKNADVIVSIGTSGLVEPAASLFFESKGKLKIMVNPQIDRPVFYEQQGIKVILEKATIGVSKAIKYIEDYLDKH
jgi:NAD-dependent deacetylase